VSSAPWRRAPLVLWRRPGVLATVAGACAVLAASVAAVPLFLSSVGSEAVALQVADRCPRDTGASRFFGASPFQVAEPGPDPFTALGDRLQPSSRWVRLDDFVLFSVAEPTRSTQATLLTRDAVFDHVEILEGGSGPGIWISDRAREETGLQPGDLAAIGRAEVPVAGIYRDLAGTSVDEYWCSHADALLLQGPDRIPPPPLILADAETFGSLQGDLLVVRAFGAYEAPLRPGLTIADADDLIDDLACAGVQADALDWCGIGSAVDVGPFASDDPDEFVSEFFASSLPYVADRARAIQTSVGGGVWPVAGFAGVAGVGLVAAAASLWFERRRKDITLLTVRGVSPAGLGVKAVLELVFPLVVGAAAGVGLAWVAVAWLGPSNQIEAAALGEAAQAGALAVLLAAATVATVVAWRVRAHHDARPRRLRVGLLPWEVGLAALTVVSHRRLGEWGVPVGQGADVSRVDVVGLLFPILFLVTVVAVFSRFLGVAVRPVRAVSRGWPTALYLAIRRVARYRVAAIGLVAASAVAAGVLAYAATLNRSLDATLDAKAQVFVGSDTAVRLAADTELPAELAGRATVVEVHRYGWLQDERGREEVAILAIDPATFGHAAFWDDTFADVPLDEVLARLAAPPRDGRIPAVLVGADAPEVVDGGITATRTVRFTIEQVAHVDAFPGLKRGSPTMYIAASAIADLDARPTTTEAWIRGDRDATLAVLETAGTPFVEDRRAGDVADQASFLTVSWTFGFMQSLGIAAGMLVIGGIAVHLEARRRGRVLGYTFARRMGLGRSQHRRALFVELAASVVVGSWLGLAAALAGARLAYGLIDPVPGFRPDPLLRPATAVIVVVAVAAVALTVVAAGLAQRRTDRDDPAEVLRAGA
jgi:putative ABC transport system permease protein